MYKKIIHVFTIFHKGRQQVGFKLEGVEKYLYLSLGNIMQDTGIDITAVEILIGSELKPVYYAVGEKMINSNICIEGQTVIKNFKFKLTDTKENLYKLNESKLLSFKKILNAFHFERNSNVTIGFDIGEEKAVFINANRIINMTSLSLQEIHILEGSYISPEYFQEGDNINYDKSKPPVICRKSGVVLKEINLRFWGKVTEMHEKFENSQPTKQKRSFYFSNYNSEESYDRNNWLEDAAGSDDSEVMNDVYWNLD